MRFENITFLVGVYVFLVGSISFLEAALFGASMNVLAGFAIMTMAGFVITIPKIRRY